MEFTQTFGYDGLKRLTSASDSGGWSRNFNYDQWGNSWVTNATGYIAGPTPTSNVYNAKNQISTLNYDPAGNLITLNGNTPSYDAENRMTSLTATGGGAEALLYDALGQRVEKTVGGSTTVYVYDVFGQLVSEYSGGLWSRDYIAEGGGELIATENASGLCTTCYFGYDHLGSVRIVMDQNGGVVARHDYFPFGEELPGGMAGRTTPGFGAADLTTQRFTGQVRDSESGQDFFNARYFMAPLGRFNSADPMNAGASLGSSQSWNGYAYVLGNPLGLTDPSGMQWRTASTQVCTAVVSTSIDYSPTDDSFVNNAGTTSECHYTNYWVWVPDPVDTVGSGGGSGGGGGGAAPANAGTVTATHHACSFSQRALMFGNGILNLTLGATKISAAGAVEVGTSGIGTGLALYGAFSGAGNVATGVLQTVGAFSSNPAAFQQAASGISAVTSITGITTLLTTGNLKYAANAARFESLGLFGFKLGSGGSFNPVSGTAASVNVAKGAGVPIGCS